MADQPHKAIRFIAMIITASIIGATIGVLVTESLSVGRILVSVSVIALAVAGALGITRNEPVLAALGGLGMLMIIDALPELGLFLFIGAIGFILTAIIAVIEGYLRTRGE